jgi:hypothetical protein
VTAGPIIDLAGTIGRLVLASLMPARRLRISPRVVERAMSSYIRSIDSTSNST